MNDSTDNLDRQNNSDREIFEHKNKSEYMRKTIQGYSRKLVKQISKDKNEPKWLLEKRLQSLELFQKMSMPSFGPDLSSLDLTKITYYAKPGIVSGDNKDWNNVPKDIKTTFERLGIPDAEKKILAGVGAQYESNVVYHSLKQRWEKKGVIFEDFDIAIKKYPEIIKKYFMKCIASNDHKFAAMHGAFFSGGTFLYVPKNVKLETPLQAYFRMNAASMGQFEHTIIILEENAEVHYIEGCSAPKYGTNSIHAGCVEIFVGKNAYMKYSSVENWSKDTYNLNTKRAIVEENGRIEWVSGNLGSGVTMLYPCSVLKGKKSTCNHLGIAFANKNQIQDTGAKVIHLGEDTSSNVVMRSLSKNGGVSIYRGLLKIGKQAKNSIVRIECNTLILDDKSKSDTIPHIQTQTNDVTIAHEASAGKLNDEDVFYLMSRGISEEEAKNMIVNGFLTPIIKSLPLEYAVELNRLIEMEMGNSIG